MTLTTDDLKFAASQLRTAIADDGARISHGRALEIVAQQLGYPDWNTAVARVRQGIEAPVPVLRIFDEQAARGFYLDLLGFELEWEHRFAPGMPLYARLRRDAAVVDISEHPGDGTPGTVVWLKVADVTALHAEIAPRAAPRQQPGIVRDAPGGPTMPIYDPFGNTLRFCQQR